MLLKGIRKNAKSGATSLGLLTELPAFEVCEKQKEAAKKNHNGLA